jgi:hypothetical protein
MLCSFIQKYGLALGEIAGKVPASTRVKSAIVRRGWAVIFDHVDLSRRRTSNCLLAIAHRIPEAPLKSKTELLCCEHLRPTGEHLVVRELTATPVNVLLLVASFRKNG